MSVEIGGAISQGIKRTATRNGLVFVVITYVLGVLLAVFSADAVTGTEAVANSQAPEISLPIPAAVSILLGIVVAILSFVVGIAALRTFVTERTDQLPPDAFSRNIVVATVNIVVGIIVFAIVVGIGFVLLIIPGIFLLVSLYFWATIVAVEDENFYGGFQESWSLTKGNRIPLFILGLLVIVIGAVVNVVFGIPRGFLGGVPGLLIAQIGSAIVGIFTAATTARVYIQLTEGAESGASAEAAAD